MPPRTEAAGLAAAIPENAAIITLDSRGEALSSRIPGGLEDDAIGNTGRNISDKWFERPGVRD